MGVAAALSLLPAPASADAIADDEPCRCTVCTAAQSTPHSHYADCPLLCALDEGGVVAAPLVPPRVLHLLPRKGVLQVAQVEQQEPGGQA